MKRGKSKWGIALRNYRRALDITGVGELMRRYFIMNSFDGTLTTIGLLMGAMVSGITQTHAILVLSLSTAIAIAISGGWGTFLTESAERTKDLRELEKQMLRKLDNSDIHHAGKTAAYSVAVVDGSAPLIAALVIVTPFFMANAGLLAVQDAFKYSFGIAAVVLFCLGTYLGRISSDNALVYGVKMLLAGAFAAGGSLLLLR